MRHRRLGTSKSLCQTLILCRCVLLISTFVALGMFNNAASGQCELQTIWSPDGGPDYFFGLSAAGSGSMEVIIVGEFGSSNFRGVAHVYRYNGTSWEYEAMLEAPDGPQIGSQFARHVDMSADGKTILISEIFDSNNGLSDTGAAWVYVEEVGIWVVQQKLTPSEAEEGWAFGENLALSADGNVAAISATGAPFDPVYVFTREGGTWIEACKLPVDNYNFSLPKLDVSADGSVIIVGADGDFDQGQSAGATFIFVRKEGQGCWTFHQKLLASDGETSDHFGFGVSLSATGDTILIGAVGDDEAAKSAGAVYVFQRRGEMWFEQVKLVPDDGMIQDLFGLHTKLTPDGQRAIIYSRNNAKYVFDFIDGKWVETMRLTASDPNVLGLGRAIAITDDGSTVLLGAPGAQVDGVFWYGAAALFDLTTACPGPGDFNAFRGFYNSGDLNSLLNSDDDKLCYNPGIVLNPSEAPVTLDFTGTLPNDSPASLDVTIESSANTVGLEVTVSFWNYNTNSWDVVGTDTQSLNTDTIRTFAGVPADHVQPVTGEVRTRYEVRVVSFIFLFPWLDCVDHVFWTID